MQKLLIMLSEKGVSSLLLAISLGLTLTTSATAGYKLLTNNQMDTADANQIEIPKSTNPQAITDSAVANQPTTPGATAANLGSSTPTPFTNPTPTSIPTPTPASFLANLASLPKAALNKLTGNTTTSSSTGSTTSNNCIITLWGQQYDVTSLRTTHSGGDVFTCGADMTTVYQNQHGTSLARMQPYLVTSSSTTAGGSGGPTTGNTSGTSSYQKDEDHDDEYEDEKNRYEDDEHESEQEDEYGD